MTVLPDTAYTPTAEELASIEEWFAEYDAAAGRRDIERMADLAVFPLNLVSDDATGQGASAQWDRRRFVDTMTRVMGGGPEDITFESTRTPVFLGPAIAVVFTDSVMTAGEHTQRLRYADVLVRRGGSWAFQTMIQGGWGDRLR
ncbi:nuclear transport factor 2 family protein [Streptomyces gamaensis]|uniref:Nuclear transport factor 2 family protein n=1 Tax=Streptomyces gamaensis TaxID=1763542 RepID=A0ABW0Z6B1_9ACTN